MLIVLLKSAVFAIMFQTIEVLSYLKQNNPERQRQWDSIFPRVAHAQFTCFHKLFSGMSNFCVCFFDCQFLAYFNLGFPFSEVTVFSVWLLWEAAFTHACRAAHPPCRPAGAPPQPLPGHGAFTRRSGSRVPHAAHVGLGPGPSLARQSKMFRFCVPASLKEQKIMVNHLNVSLESIKFILVSAFNSIYFTPRPEVGIHFFN